jgi:putative membrane protein
MRFIIHFLITIVALIVAVALLPGIYIEGTNAFAAFAVMALIMGLANIFLRPLLTLISLGCIIFTLGLFFIIINAAILWISSWISVNLLDVGFHVDGFWNALFGSLIISLVSFVFSLFIRRR